MVKSIRRWSDIEIICITNMTEPIDDCQFVYPARYEKDRGTWPKSPIHVTEAFGWTEYDRIIVMQPDMLVVGDLNRILNSSLPEFGATPAYGVSPPQNRNGMRTFNDGLLVVKPSIKMRDEVLAFNGFGGQAATNDYAYNNQWACELPYTWNMSKRWFTHHKPAWNMIKSEIIVLHYVGKDKPWSGGDERYTELNNIWRAHADGDYIAL